MADMRRYVGIRRPRRTFIAAAADSRGMTIGEKSVVRKLGDLPVKPPSGQERNDHSKTGHFDPHR
jgi:hypothetical protein